MLGNTVLGAVDTIRSGKTHKKNRQEAPAKVRRNQAAEVDELDHDLDHDRIHDDAPKAERPLEAVEGHPDTDRDTDSESSSGSESSSDLDSSSDSDSDSDAGSGSGSESSSDSDD